MHRHEKGCGSSSHAYALTNYNMQTMKRKSEASVERSVTKTRSVSCATFLKWKAELDKGYLTKTWLDYEPAGPMKKTVIKQKCKVCTNFQSKIADPSIDM